MVLINCGGCLNLLELLQPSSEEDEEDQNGMGRARGHHGDVTFYVIDSQRPLELDNVYNQDQVHMVLREGEELELPDFDDIYASDMVREKELSANPGEFLVALSMCGNHVHTGRKLMCDVSLNLCHEICCLLIGWG